MPKTKLHAVVQKHKAKTKSKGDRQPSKAKAIALEVYRIDWSQIDNPFILPDGAQIYE